MPAKISTNGKAREFATVRACEIGKPCPKTIKSSKYFSADIEAFGGNSGSVVIDSVTKKALGVLVRGGADLETVQMQDGSSCKRHVICTDNCGGEDIMYLTPLKNFIEQS